MMTMRAIRGPFHSSVAPLRPALLRGISYLQPWLRCTWHTHTPSLSATLTPHARRPNPALPARDTISLAGAPDQVPAAGLSLRLWATHIRSARACSASVRTRTRTRWLPRCLGLLVPMPSHRTSLSRRARVIECAWACDRTDHRARRSYVTRESVVCALWSHLWWSVFFCVRTSQWPQRPP